MSSEVIGRSGGRADSPGGPAPNLRRAFLIDMFRTRVNRALDILGLEIRRWRPAGSTLKPWDKQFLTWVEKARQQDRDVNDVADER